MVAFCRSQDWEIVGPPYIDDGYSASSLERPALQRLLRDIRNGGIDVIVVWRLDRLTRSVRDLNELLEIFHRYDVAFRSVTEIYETATSNGRLFMNLVALIAQWEREAFQERSRFGKEQRARTGLWHGGIPPYGYRYDPEQSNHLLINSAQADVVRKIFDMYVNQDMGYSAIAKALIKQGVEPPGHPRIANRGSGRWYTGTIRKIIQNPTYVGYVVHGDERFSGGHKPIINEQVWKEAQRKREQRMENQRAPKTRSLLSGLLVCGVCGGKMRQKKAWVNWREVVQRKTQRERRYDFYYVCYNYLKDPVDKITGECDAGYRRCKVVDQNVIDALRQYALDPVAVEQSIRESIKEDDVDQLHRRDAIKQIRGELTEVQKSINRWYEAFESGNADLAPVLERVKELRAQRDALQKHLDDLMAAPERQQAVQEQIDFLRQALTDLGHVIDRLDRGSLRQAIEKVVDQVIVYRDGSIDIVWYVPEELSVDSAD